MLKIFYKTSIYCYKLKQKVSSGMIATFEDDRKVCICDSKSIPIGFFTNDSDIPPYEMNFEIGKEYQTVPVVVGQGEYQTDIFEKSEYKINDFLYCSDNGKITNEKKYKGNIIIGIVNSITKENIAYRHENLDIRDFIGFITCFARGLEKE